MEPETTEGAGLWGARLLTFDKLGSTNDWTLEHAAELRDGDVVRARRQTAHRFDAVGKGLQVLAELAHLPGEVRGRDRLAQPRLGLGQAPVQRGKLVGQWREVRRGRAVLRNRPVGQPLDAGVQARDVFL